MALPTSGPNFDFSMFPRRYWGESLGNVGGDIADAIRWRREQERKEAADRQTAQFENDQNRNSEKRAKTQEMRADVAWKQSQARAQGADAKNILALLGGRRYDEAQAAAAASQYEDPTQPGTLVGAKLKRYILGPNGKPQDYDEARKAMGPGAPAPVAPTPTDPAKSLSWFLGNRPKPESLEPPAFGQEPQEPAPDLARAGAALTDPMAQMQLLGGAESARQGDQKAQATYEQQLQQRQVDDKQREADLAARERWGLTFGGGQETLIDPRQAEQAARSKAEEEAQLAEAQLANEHDPMARDALRRTIIEKRAMLSNMDKAAVNNAAAQSASQGFKKEQQDLHETTAAQKYQIGMTAAQNKGRNQGPESPANKRYDLAVSAEARNKMTATLNQAEFKPVIESRRMLTQMLTALRSDNSANHKLAAGLWAKWSSGPGAVQQSERQEFMNTIGGKLGEIEKVLKNWADGKLPDDQRQILVEAIEQHLMPTTEANYQAIRNNVHATFANDPNSDVAKYADWADRYMDSYSSPSLITPGKQPRQGAPQPAPGRGAGPAAPRAGGGGGSHPQDGEAIKWARAHPKDPLAAQILQANGLTQ